MALETGLLVSDLRVERGRRAATREIDAIRAHRQDNRHSLFHFIASCSKTHLLESKIEQLAYGLLVESLQIKLGRDGASSAIFKGVDGAIVP